MNSRNWPDWLEEIRYARGIWTLREMSDGVPPEMIRIVRDGIIRDEQHENIDEFLAKLHEGMR